MRIRLAVCTTLVVSGIAAALGMPAAAAASPTITRQVPFSGTFADGIDCDGFVVAFAYGGERTYIDSYASDGSLIKEIRQIAFTGTLTNSVTGASVPYEGRFVRTYDATAQTLTITGLSTKVLIPGQGAIAMTAGRSVLDLMSGEGTSVGTDDFDPNVCSALTS